MDHGSTKSSGSSTFHAHLDHLDHFGSFVDLSNLCYHMLPKLPKHNREKEKSDRLRLQLIVAGRLQAFKDLPCSESDPRISLSPSMPGPRRFARHHPALRNVSLRWPNHHHHPRFRDGRGSSPWCPVTAQSPGGPGGPRWPNRGRIGTETAALVHHRLTSSYWPRQGEVCRASRNVRYVRWTPFMFAEWLVPQLKAKTVRFYKSSP